MTKCVIRVLETLFLLLIKIFDIINFSIIQNANNFDKDFRRTVFILTESLTKYANV